MSDLSPTGRTTALAELRSDLSLLLAEMDELGLFQAGAHLAMSIHCLEQQADVPHDEGRTKVASRNRAALTD